jgi:hypothetical protein
MRNYPLTGTEGQETEVHKTLPGSEETMSVDLLQEIGGDLE